MSILSSKKKLMAAGAMAVGAVALFPEAALAGTGTGSQTVGFTTTGLLTITASPVTASTNITAGSTLSGLTNSVAMTDTMADSTAWTATAAGTDCVPAANSSLSVPLGLGTNAILPASVVSIVPGTPTGTQVAAAPVTPLAGTGGSFQFDSSYPDSQPGGSAYSRPVTIATGPWASPDSASANDGVFTQQDPLSINPGSNAVSNAIYTCNIQYTITG